MERAEIVSPRSLDPALPPQIALDYVLEECNDVTAQDTANLISDPNAGIWQVRATTAVLDQIDADGWLILWREEIPVMP